MNLIWLYELLGTILLSFSIWVTNFIYEDIPIFKIFHTMFFIYLIYTLFSYKKNYYLSLNPYITLSKNYINHGIINGSIKSMGIIICQVLGAVIGNFIVYMTNKNYDNEKINNESNISIYFFEFFSGFIFCYFILHLLNLKDNNNIIINIAVLHSLFNFSCFEFKTGLINPSISFSNFIISFITQKNILIYLIFNLLNYLSFFTAYMLFSISMSVKNINKKDNKEENIGENRKEKINKENK